MLKRTCCPFWGKGQTRMVKQAGDFLREGNEKMFTALMRTSAATVRLKRAQWGVKHGRAYPTPPPRTGRSARGR